jgi:L-ascorbate metabolism protein UlaG (beta-lactamase superfamily)
MVEQQTSKEQHMATQAALLEEIDRFHVGQGQLALWALGQAGFAIKGENTIAYIDPYLSNSIGESGGPQRRFPSPLDPAAITHAQIVFATHDHADHADGATLGPLLGASPTAVLVTSSQAKQIAVDAGVAADRVVVPTLGERAEIAGFKYTAVPAAHYAYEVDEQHRSRWMGFVIENNGVTLYHAGDTIVIPQLLDALKDVVIDVALLPINGRDYQREQAGLVGNLWPREAVDLAQQIEAKVLIGVHNDMFANNRVNPASLFDEIERRAPWQRCHLLQPGELFLYAG